MQTFSRSFYTVTQLYMQIVRLNKFHMDRKNNHSLSLTPEPSDKRCSCIFIKISLMENQYTSNIQNDYYTQHKS